MSSTDENYTPNTPEQPIIDLVLEVFDGRIDLDPCSNSLDNPNVPADVHYTKEIDGLGVLWNGNIFLNPPYSNPLPFLETLAYNLEMGSTKQAIALLKSGTIHNKGTGKLIEDYASAICFWGAGKNRRIGFINADGEQRMEANFDCVLVYFGNHAEEFNQAFSAYGHVMRTF
jgi:hypothetical protein